MAGEREARGAGGDVGWGAAWCGSMPGSDELEDLRVGWKRRVIFLFQWCVFLEDTCHTLCPRGTESRAPKRPCTGTGSSWISPIGGLPAPCDPVHRIVPPNRILLLSVLPPPPRLRRAPRVGASPQRAGYPLASRAWPRRPDGGRAPPRGRHPTAAGVAAAHLPPGGQRPPAATQPPRPPSGW